MEVSDHTKSTVLIIDDDPVNLGVLFDYLGNLGFEILLSQDGKSAVLQAEQEQPDVILLDVIMPGIEGFETCRRLKSNQNTKDIPVIFITALTDTADKVQGFEVGGVDYITKPLQYEEVLARVKAHLTIRKQQQHIQKQNEHLRELNVSKDRFFSIIAHDLRGPLSSLRNLAQLVTENFDNYRPDEFKKMISLQYTATENLYKLMDNLLTWSRIQRGMIDYRPQQMDLRMIIVRNVTLLTPNAEQKQITLKNLVQEQMGVYADLNMVDTVVRNLISNALKFTKPGGIVAVSVAQDEQYVEVSISDTGVGIPEKTLPLLFRIDVNCKRLGTAREEGTGLGLILCKEFVERHSGRIWVESEVGKGTTFRFTLPRKPWE